MGDREFDVVVVGATGVTGRRVAAYLSRRADETGASWAAAARDGEKLAAVLGDVGADGAATITLDIGDETALRALAARAKVVLNLVGPYTRHARPHNRGRLVRPVRGSRARWGHRQGGGRHVRAEQARDAQGEARA